MPYSVYGGVPARFIKHRFSEDVINKLVCLKWWNYALYNDKTVGLNLDDFEASLLLIEQLILEKSVAVLNPKKYLIESSGVTEL
ncbi:hypothetical protein [Vibrio metschnikovii]|uniref:hypothetical protein n=1 Tax=Vibrio metschnikovii TaxID=28172 RepID=UPI00315D481C